jgi:hypothetical protein
LLLDGPEGQIARLVEAAAVVAEHAGVPVALIGGLAVACRVVTGQRPTGDVDLVSDTQTDVVAGGSAADNLVDADLAERDPGTASIRLWVAGTKVEIIETQEVPPEVAADIEPERNQLFVLAHRRALESASPVTLSVVDSQVGATIAVAQPAALVAMKLHSIQTRTEDRKRASDAWDLHRLLDAHNSSGQITTALRAGPQGLAKLVAEALDRVFRIDVTRTRRWVVSYGDPVWAPVLTEDRLGQMAAEVVDRI